MITFYSQDKLDYGVILHRVYEEGNADQLGTVSFWNQKIRECYRHIPFFPYWEGLELWIYDMDLPELRKRNENGEFNLRDYSSQTGLQVATGLYWNKNKLELGVFPKNWNGYTDSGFEPTAEDVIKAAKVLSHELGHLHADLCGYRKGKSEIELKIIEQFNLLRPKQGHNEDEDWAECYRAFFGCNEAIGMFSNDVPFSPLKHAKLYTLMKCAYWLKENLKHKLFRNFKVFEQFVEWEEWEQTTIWIFYIPITTWRKKATLRLHHDYKVVRL